MNNILTIIKKELRRFFTDKRMLISFILPGLIIYILYSVIGGFMGDAFTPSEEHTYNVIVEDMPSEYKVILDNSEYDINYVESNGTIEEIKEEIADKNIDLYINFDFRGIIWLGRPKKCRLLIAILFNYFRWCFIFRPLYINTNI